MQVLNENSGIFGPGYFEAAERACAAQPSEQGTHIGAIKLELVSSGPLPGPSPKPGNNFDI